MIYHNNNSIGLTLIPDGTLHIITKKSLSPLLTIQEWQFNFNNMHTLRTRPSSSNSSSYLWTIHNHQKSSLTLALGFKIQNIHSYETTLTIASQNDKLYFHKATNGKNTHTLKSITRWRYQKWLDFTLRRKNIVFSNILCIKKIYHSFVETIHALTFSPWVQLWLIVHGPLSQL